MKRFWSNASGSYKIDSEALHKFLMERGFHSFVTYENDKIFVVERDKIIQQVSHKQIREHCWTYINKEYVFDDSEERRLVIDLFYRNQTILNVANLLLLDEIVLKEIKDNEDTSYLFFKNCILKVIRQE